jgi:hypothetical protein
LPSGTYQKYQIKFLIKSTPPSMLVPRNVLFQQGATDFNIYIDLMTDNTLTFKIVRNGLPYPISTQTQINDGNWHTVSFYATQYGSDISWSFAVDTAPTTFNEVNGGNIAVKQPSYLGGLPSNSPNSNFVGTIKYFTVDYL